MTTQTMTDDALILAICKRYDARPSEVLKALSGLAAAPHPSFGFDGVSVTRSGRPSEFLDAIKIQNGVPGELKPDGIHSGTWRLPEGM